MEAMTISKVTLERNKIEARLHAAVRAHGEIGRGGSVLDNGELIRKLALQLSDWDRLVAYAENR